MGNPKAFLTIKRKEAGYRPISDRIKDFSEVEQTLNPEDRRLQASRCMAAYLSVIGAVLSEIDNPSGKTDYIRTTFEVLMHCSVRQMTFLSLQGVYALLSVKKAVSLTRLMKPSR